MHRQKHNAAQLQEFPWHEHFSAGEASKNRQEEMFKKKAQSTKKQAKKTEKNVCALTFGGGG